ncbi:nuclear pore complex protein NUP107 [Carex littledalei]|uniref:Nuclear pore complex protein n=1 Tax=Carex littledalei TaxID=544730 RepID=A0A833VUN3_9POAL|nr:nuclear pore complex protein NUP107 [Carex littledalei]
MEMEMEVDAPPSLFDPTNDTHREQYRRYRHRRRQSASSNVSPLLQGPVSRFSDASLLYEGNTIQRRPNSALLLEEIKQELETDDVDGMDGNTPLNSAMRRASIDSRASGEFNSSFGPARQTGMYSLQPIKGEEEDLSDEGSTFSLFASLLDSALQGLMSFQDLILQLEKTCRDVSESIRFGSTVRHRVVEDKFMRQKAKFLIDEAASWSLFWYLFGKGVSFEVSPPTSHQQACQFVRTDLMAEACVRIVLWLEGLASEALDLEKKVVRGSHVGSYLPSSGVWHHTQRFLRRKNYDPAIVQHVDFDAPTREEAKLISDDKAIFIIIFMGEQKQDELLLEDVWTLLKAGRLEEACELCSSAGQASATLCPFRGIDIFPSVEAMMRNGKSRTLQAIELEGRVGHQLRLWKWASFCASEKISEQDGGKYETAVYAVQCSNLKHVLPVCTDWESACWAMVKCWLDAQVDLHLSQLQKGGGAISYDRRSNEDEMSGSLSGGSEHMSLPPVSPGSWPYQILDQQPRDMSSLLQKLHSSDMVHEAVSRSCREQHRQIQMRLMLGDVSNLLDLLWSWISPSESDWDDNLRPQGDPEMMRFGAHLVLVLRYIIDVELKEVIREKLETIGDRILHLYVMYLFSQQHEEWVGVYASQLVRHLCVDLFVQMMELRLNSRMSVKHKLFRSAVQYLPFSSEDNSKACFEEIIDRVLSRSRETKLSKNDADMAEHHRLQSLEKAMVIQWLCFTPPSTIKDFQGISVMLLVKALMHSNILFREFALISMWRVPETPIGAHKLLAFLSEPLQQPKDNLLSLNDPDVSDNLHEFEDWHAYYCWDATYRKWLKAESENGVVPPDDLSSEEKDASIAFARQTLSSALALLIREGDPWLSAAQESAYNSTEHVFLELHAVAMLCLPSRECVAPDATHCAALTSALYSSVSEEVVLHRQLTVDVTISSEDSSCIEVILRCLAVEGDGLGFHEANDGGLLATVMADGFKGELNQFQFGVAMEISRIDAWYSDDDHLAGPPATYVVRGLCRRCCIPETILRCMQVAGYLSQAGDSVETSEKLIELVASADYGILHLFSQRQLQEFLSLQRDLMLHQMVLEEEAIALDA